MSDIIRNSEVEFSVTSPPSQLANFVDADKVFSWAGTVNMSDAGEDNPVFQLYNPMGSGVKVYINKVYAGVAISNNWSLLKLFHNPTITANGTVATTMNNNLGSATNGEAEAYTLPTVSANGSEMRNLFNGENNNSIIFVEDNAILVPEGQRILITGEPKSNNRDMSLTVVWVEL